MATIEAKPADDEAFGVDHHPLLLDVGGLCRKGFHSRYHPGWAHSRAVCAGF